MAIKVGDKAPEFQLYASDKQVVGLSDFKGQHVLLLFFPMAFSSTCTAELCQVRDELAMYNQMNCVVLGISVDSLYTLARFKEELGLTYTLLSDYNKGVSRAYGALYEVWNYGMRGVGKRAAFLINTQGVVKYAEVLENASLLPDFASIAGTLSRLK
ncbi:MAG: redoxin domain-containing protein [Saprospiraceae bacterium]|nr:redoxin domain-containing protein [Saprospiraceae bacterium]